MTFGELAKHYLASQRFTAMPASTRQTFRAIIKASVAKVGEHQIAALRSEHIYKGLMARAATSDDVDAANDWLRTMKALMRFAKDWGARDDDPAASVPFLRHPKAEPRSLYIIRAGKGSLFKVGIAGDAISRLKELQIGSPSLLELVLAVDISSPNIEREAHQILAPWRRHGEWFDLGVLADYFATRIQRSAGDIQSLLAALQEVRKDAEPSILRLTC